MRIAGLVALVCTAIALAALASDVGNVHDPITISSNDEFTLENGVIAGRGTAEAPYIVAGWTIAAGTQAAIRIQGTSAHFVIRDCHLSGDRRQGIGILLGESDLPRAKIEHSTFEGLRAGVFAYRNVGVRIETCSFADCRKGIDGSEADGMVLRDNQFSAAGEHAIFLWRCHTCVLEANLVADGQNGFYLDSCRGAALRGNRVDGAERGIFLWDCFDCIVEGNDLRNCDLGIALVHTSADNTVFHNRLAGNSRAATCDEADNRWDNGYPSGGNYWGPRDEADLLNGPQQDLPGSDGILDSALAVPFAGIDRYPLALPPSASDTGPN